jgi:hypothetical protein
MKCFGKYLAVITLTIIATLSQAKPVVDHEVRGQLTLIASPKANVNPSSPFDQVVLPNVVIPFTVTETGQLRSTFQWSGKTRNGFSVDWQLAGPGAATANWNAGTFTFDLPFIFNCAGKRLPLRLKFTSGQHTDSFGSVQGFARKVSDTTADLLLHAPASFFFNWKDLLPNGENKDEEFVGRVTFRGQLVAVNGNKLFQ